MSLYQTEDAVITKILEADRDFVKAEFGVKIDSEQIPIFNDLREHVLFGFRSSLARFGLNIQPEGNFVLEGNHVVGQGRVYNFIPQYSFADVGIDVLFKTGDPLGRYKIDDPSLHVQSHLIKEYIEQRRVMVGEGWKIHLDGILNVPLQKRIFVPNGYYTKDALKGIINTKESRSRLTKYQRPQDVDAVIAPKDGGVVSVATLMTSDLEVIVRDPSNLGIKHSEARIGTQHTRFEFFGEYVGNGEGDVEINGIDVVLCHPRIKKTKVFVPASLDKGTAIGLEDKTSLKRFSSKFQYPSDHTQFIEYISLMGDLDGAYRRFSRDSQNPKEHFTSEFQKKKDISLIFNQFPGVVGKKIKGDLLHDLISLSREGILKAIYFSNAQNGIFFYDTSLADIKKLSDNGVIMHWYNPHTKRWMVYHSGFWVNPDKLQEFIDYYESGKLVAFYGSSMKISGKVAKTADATLDGIVRFHGGKAGIITGGWGGENSFMQYVSKRAKDKNLLVGAVFWNVPGQSQNVDVDFQQNYDERHLLPRQELMGKVVEKEVYGPGGFGTALEFYYVMTIGKIGIGARKSILLLGEARKYRSDVEEMIRNGLAPQEAINGIYEVGKGRRVYDILCKHFKTMR